MIAALYPEVDQAERNDTSMTIEFRNDSTTGSGSFVRVLRGGRRFGRIFHAAGVHRFYTARTRSLARPTWRMTTSND